MTTQACQCSIQSCFCCLSSLCLQGLCDAVRRRLPEWHVEAPTRVQVSLPFHLPADDIRRGMQCAMRQLSVLPAGSDIHWAGSTHLPSIIKDGGPPRVDSDVCQWPWRSVTSGSCRKDGLGGRMVFFSSLLELRRPTGPCDLDITALHDNTYAHKVSRTHTHTAPTHTQATQP